MNNVEGEIHSPLIYNNKLINSSIVEKYLIDETLDCIRNKDDILICYPNPLYLIPLIIETVLNNELENFKFSEDPTKRTTVLIISRNKELINILKNFLIKTDYIYDVSKIQHRYLMDRNVFCDINNPYYAKLYWKHILTNYYEGNVPDKLPLHYFFPISYGYHTFTQLSRGNMNKIGRKDNIQKSVFFISSNINLIYSNDTNYDYVFIDYTTIEKYIPIIRKGTLVYFNKPLDDRISYFNRKENVKNYIFSSEILEQFISSDKSINSPFFCSITEMVLNTKISNINIEKIKADFEDELENAFHLLMKLIKKKFDTYDLNLIRKLLYNIIEMPVEGVIYDSIARFDPISDTINDLIKELKESDNRYEDDDFEQIIKSLEDIYNKYNLDTFCPKYEALREIINKEMSNKRTVGIIISNKIRGIALKEKLATTFGVEIEQLEDLGITFFNKKKLITKHQYINSDTVIMFSATSVHDFEIFYRLEEVKKYILLYKIEIEELIKKFSRFIHINNKALSIFNNTDRERLKSKNMYNYFFKRLKRHAVFSDISNFDADLSLMKLKDIIINDRSIPRKRVIKEYTGENAVLAKLIKLDGNGEIFFRKNSKIRYLDKKQKKIITKKLSEVKRGSEIVLIDNDSRKELYNVFINSSEVDNHSLYNYSIIQEWREKYVDKYVSLQLSDEILYKKMKELGWDKTTKSILSNWRSGYSFGPRDLIDIVLLGKVLKIEDFLERAKEYHEAMSSIRVERRVAARLLNKIIYYSKKVINRDDLAFLSKYNLSIEDVRNAVKIRKIISISEKVYKVKPSEVGILFE
jgi:hypothetical protein